MFAGLVAPRGVLSYQGRNFESRTFRTITNVISKIAEEQKEWDQHLLKVLLALRASTHETTGFSPSMLMFGREMRLPIDAMREETPSEEPSDYPPFVKKQREILKGVQVRVEKNLAASLRHQKDVYMHAARGNQDRTKLVIWYGWRRRPFPGGCTGSSIDPGLDLGGSSRLYQMSPTEYSVRKLLPCGRGVR